jgi:hypothetical protein
MGDIHIRIDEDPIVIRMEAASVYPIPFTSLTDVPQTYHDQGGKYLKVKSAEDGLEFGTASGMTDEKVKYDSGDTVAGYLADKIIAGTGITLTEGTGADENKLKITADIQTTDISGKVDKVTGSSLVADTEIAKIHAAGSDNQDLSGKQDVLVSGTNIKTINSNSLIGSGDLSIVSSGGIASSYIFCEDPMFNGVNASPLLYNVLTPYGANAVVISSFGLYWRSLQAGNAGNALAENAWWTRAWHELEKQSDGGTVGNHTVTTGNNVYVEIDRYVTAALATTVIPAGNWKFIIYAKSSLIGLRMQMKADIYRVDSTGTISGTVLGTASTAIFNNPATVGIEASVYISEQTGWSLTDRIGIVISGRRTDDSGTLTWYHDVSQGWASEVNTPLSLLHNQMNGLNQGDYQHLTAAEKTAVNAKADKSFVIAMSIAL